MHMHNGFSTERKMMRSEIFHGILAAHIFPSLADVLIEPLESDDFSPLDLSLHNMDDNYHRNMAEEDFLNPHAVEIDQSEMDDIETDMHQLESPEDLLIPITTPMWSESEESFDECEVGLIEYEIMASVEHTTPPCYPHSPGSVGDMSDDSSDCSFEPGTDTYRTENLIELTKITETMHNEEVDVFRTNTIFHPKVKLEPQNLPDESVFRPYYNTFDENESKRSLSDSSDPYDEEDSSSDSCIKSVDTQKRKRPGRKKGQTSSVYHLWEFIRDLLHNPEHCPNIIKWEDEKEGIFRVLKSTEVAKEWGSMKKNKTKMTYEKLSRSLRYSRKEGYFDDIPKDRGLPKKLCFKFGPKSHGWRRRT